MTKLQFFDAGWTVLWHLAALLLNWWVVAFAVANVAFVGFFGAASRLGGSDDEPQ